MKRLLQRHILCVLLLICLTGCQAAPPLINEQERITYQTRLNHEKEEYYFDRTARISRIGYQLLKHLPPADQRKPVHRIPLILLESGNYFNHFQTGTRDVKGLTVLDPLLLGRTQVRRGDLLIAVNQVSVSSMNSVSKILSGINVKTVNLTFQRGSQKWNEVWPVEKIGYDIPFLIDPQITTENAYRHIKGFIAVTPLMLRFVESDDELAFVLGHEIAHAVKGHLGQQILNQSFGLLAGTFVASMMEEYAAGSGSSSGTLTHAFTTAPYSQEMEFAADKAAIQYMVNAGYDPEAALSFMVRFSVTHPASEHPFLNTHPATDARFSRLKSIAEGYKNVQ